MNVTRLIELSKHYCSAKEPASLQMPGLSVLRRESPSNIEAVVYEPVLCLILQGSKVTSIGDQSVKLGPGDALIVSHDLPVVSRITKASAREPYLAVILKLDLQLIRSLYEQVIDAFTPSISVRSLSVAKIDDTWLAPLIRYIDLINNRFDANVLGPATLQEIHYRLLQSDLGGMLRNLLVTDSHASRIAKAIQKLRAEYRSTIKLHDLAQSAAMSASSFHAHFKAVTGTTPLQYQKDLRLIAAQTLLATSRRSVSEVAYSVGYESPNHFSRDYSRKFGFAPKLRS
jgi:AraC-like DNA-binding protein